jgi:hypothetical protein
MIVLPAVDFGTVSSSITSAQTLPLSTPLLYFFGLTFRDSDPNYRGAYIQNPVYRQINQYGNPYWVSDGVYLTYYNGWLIQAGCEYYDGKNGWVNSYAGVASNSAPNTSIPLKGWILLQSPFIVAGTLVIKTTP